MSDAVEAKALDLLDKGGAALGQFADKLGDLAKQYGPDVVNGALEIARIDALSQLVPSILFLAVLAYFGGNATQYLRKLFDEGDDALAIPLLVVGGIITAVLGLCAIATVCDVWVWVGVFEPKLYLAKKILGL